MLGRELSVLRPTKKTDMGDRTVETDKFRCAALWCFRFASSPPIIPPFGSANVLQSVRSILLRSITCAFNVFGQVLRPKQSAGGGLFASPRTTPDISRLLDPPFLLYNIMRGVAGGNCRTFDVTMIRAEDLFQKFFLDG
jgi:hypothetical protein